MKTALKWLVILIALLAGANAGRSLYNKAKQDLVSPDGKHDVVDSFIGKTALDNYLEIENERDTFNLPALKTSLMMFQTQHGRFPRNLSELEQSGDASADVTRDRFGNEYEMRAIDNRTILLHSAGKDKIKGTTDDIEYQLSL